MDYKNFIKFSIIVNLLSISNIYSKTCPELTQNEILRLVSQPFNQNSPLNLQIGGDTYTMHSSDKLILAIKNYINNTNQIIDVNNKKLSLKRLNERSEIEKVEGPQLPNQKSSSMHVCKYKVLSQRMVYDSLPGTENEELELYIAKE